MLTYSLNRELIASIWSLPSLQTDCTKIMLRYFYWTIDIGKKDRHTMHCLLVTLQNVNTIVKSAFKTWAYYIILKTERFYSTNFSGLHSLLKTLFKFGKLLTNLCISNGCAWEGKLSNCREKKNVKKGRYFSI